VRYLVCKEHLIPYDRVLLEKLVCNLKTSEEVPRLLWNQTVNGVYRRPAVNSVLRAKSTLDPIPLKPL
jgi:hypothetical protein